MQTKYTISFIRQSWLKIFCQEGYYLLQPSSLIPRNDRSLYLINSGVAALKEYFRNPHLLPSSNLVNCQPVVRTDDISQIDEFSYHQTLFEMLGSFSIGGKFKNEVIPIIWSFLISYQWLKIDPARLFITVLEDDKVSYQVWSQLVSEDHIILGSKQTNFWDIGFGPCGPNTEVYYDFQLGSLPKTTKELDNKRFIEICNIVFPEFYHHKNGYSDLETKCVDIGVGLERLSMVLQGKNSTFEIDLWSPVINLISQIAERNKIKLTNLKENIN